MSEEQPRILPGKPNPLGASLSDEGVNFAVYAQDATSVELCLFDEAAGAETERIELTERTGFVWHCFIRDCKAGQLYGFRVARPVRARRWPPLQPAKLLIDPYARAIAGSVDWDAPVFGYPIGAETTTSRSTIATMRCGRAQGRRGRPDASTGATTARREIPWHRSVIYEAARQGLHQPPPRRPAASCAAPTPVSPRQAVDRPPQDLGVTAVELLPVHAFVDDEHLVEQGLTTTGATTRSTFSPPTRATPVRGDRGEQVSEFKEMVKALHAAGIEVILDVVYNHTAEGNHLGPTLSLPGHRQRHLLPAGRRTTRATTWTTPAPATRLNVRHPQVLQLIMDSLRYWVQEMHVDGFRFDLASALARELHDVDRLSAFFDVIHQDPVLSQVKLIAEPWDVGEGGYQVGNFPVLWAEWNGKYRDTRARASGRATTGTLRELAYRLTGSSDLYEDDGRTPYASINFVTAHDGFTLHDLVSYNDKHNEANGETTATAPTTTTPGTAAPRARPTTRRSTPLRERQKRNFLATLLLLAGRADDLRRRRDGPHPGRQQQRLLPGQRDHLVRLEPRTSAHGSCSTSPAELHCGRRSTRPCAGATSSTAGRSAAANPRTSPGCGPTARR